MTPCDGTLAHIRITSGIVERQHLLASELKPGKSRVMAMDALVLGMIGYRRTVANEARHISDLVHKEIVA